MRHTMHIRAINRPDPVSLIEVRCNLRDTLNVHTYIHKPPCHRESSSGLMTIPLFQNKRLSGSRLVATFETHSTRTHIYINPLPPRITLRTHDHTTLSKQEIIWLLLTMDHRVDRSQSWYATKKQYGYIKTPCARHDLP